MSSSESTLDNSPKKRKKGVKDPHSYKANVIKRARVKGMEYVNWKGNTVPEIPSGCDNHCK